MIGREPGLANGFHLVLANNFKGVFVNKPVEKTMKYMDYQECADWVAYRMGVGSLGDFCGKYSGNKDAEYLDFWHCICNNQDVHNPCWVRVDRDYNWPDWAIPIVDVFQKEFGDTEYFVEW